MTGPGDFTALYDQYRIGAGRDYHAARAHDCRRQGNVLLAATFIPLALAVACDMLAETRRGEAELWLGAGGFLTFAALAVAAAALTSGHRQQARKHQAAADALAAMHHLMPAPTAGEPEISRWVWQTETILHGAQADSSPLRDMPSLHPASRREL